MPWHKCTPAFPKPMPANAAASLPDITLVDTPTYISQALLRHIQHLPPCFRIIPILRNSWQILYRLLKRPKRENVRNGIASLVRWAVDWVGRARYAFGVPGKSVCQISPVIENVRSTDILTESQCNSPVSGRARQGRR